MTEQPTHLYHGTTGEVARRALVEGLRPRGETGAASNWEHTVSSNFDLVYLTASYAPYFAMTAQPKGIPVEDQRWAVLEIDLARLDDGSLFPDEDFLEQGSRDAEMPTWTKGLGLDRCKTMKDRTVWFRTNIAAFQELWPASIEHLGTAAHLGTIPPEAISRVGIFTPNREAAAIVQSVSDPMISIMNYKFMGDRYQALSRWFVGHPLTLAEFYGELCWPGTTQFLRPVDRDALKQVLASHPGLEVIRS